MMMPQHGAEAAGGYNFQRVMEDHFEHYKRPPSLNPTKNLFPRRRPTDPKTRGIYPWQDFLGWANVCE